MSKGKRRSRRRRSRRFAVRTLQVGALVVVLFGLVTARVVISGEAEISASTEALRRGDAQAATVHARRAAGWYAPGAPHVRVAYDRLRALGRAAEEHKRIDIALLAWRGVRSAALETRWISAPYGTDLELANQQIARLMAANPAGTPSPAKPDRAFAGEQQELLARAQAPRLPWVIGLVGSFGLGAVGMVAWSRQLGRSTRRRSRRTEAGHSWRRSRWGLTLVVLGFALWLLSVWRA